MTGDTGFQFKYNLAGRTSGIIRKFPIYNSLCVAVGDMVYLTGGGLGPCPATAAILGCCVGLVDRDGIDLGNSKITKEGTYSASAKSYTADSDNMTSEKAAALVDLDPFSVWSVEPDGTIGTDDEGDMAGSYTDLVATAGDQADEDVSSTGKAQLFIWGIDPEDSTRILVSIAQHALSGDTAT